MSTIPLLLTAFLASARDRPGADGVGGGQVLEIAPVSFEVIADGRIEPASAVPFQYHAIYSAHQLSELRLGAMLDLTNIDFAKEILVVVLGSYTVESARVAVNEVTELRESRTVEIRETHATARAEPGAAASWTWAQAIKFKASPGKVFFQPSEPRPFGPQPIGLIEAGDLAGPARDLVIRSPEELTTSGVELCRPLDDDFFQKSMLLAVFLGTQPLYDHNVAIHQVVRRVTDSQGELSVSVRLGVPGDQDTGTAKRPSLPEAPERIPTAEAEAFGWAPYIVVAVPSYPEDRVVWHQGLDTIPLGPIPLTTLSLEPQRIARDGLRTGRVSTRQDWYDFVRHLETPPAIPQIEWGREHLLIAAGEILEASRELLSSNTHAVIDISARSFDPLDGAEDEVDEDWAEVPLHVVKVHHDISGPLQWVVASSQDHVQRSEEEKDETRDLTVVTSLPFSVEYELTPVLKRQPLLMSKGLATEAEILELLARIQAVDFPSRGGDIDFLEPSGVDATFTLSVDIKQEQYSAGGIPGYYRDSRTLNNAREVMEPFMLALDGIAERVVQEQGWKKAPDPFADLKRLTKRSTIVDGNQILVDYKLRIDSKRNATLVRSTNSKEKAIEILAAEELASLEKALSEADFSELPRSFVADGASGSEYELTIAFLRWQKHAISGSLGSYQDGDGNDYEVRVRPIMEILDSIEARLEARLTGGEL